MPPSDGRPPPVRNDWPWPPSSASVSVRGYRYRPTTRWFLQGSVVPVPSHQVVLGHSIYGEIHPHRYSYLIGAYCLRGWPCPQICQACSPGRLLGRNGAYPELIFLPPGLHLLHIQAAICLPWEDYGGGNPPVVDIPVDTFVVRRSIRTVSQEYRVSHLGVFPPLVFKKILCKRAEKLMPGGHDLACRGLAFVPPDSATHLLYRPDITIVDVSQAFFPLLSGWFTAFKEALDWLQFAFEGVSKGAYLDPASTVFVWSMLAEGWALFSPVLEHLWWRFPRS